MKLLIHAVTAAAFASSLPPVGFAQEAKPSTAPSVAVSQGEVKKIDQDAGRLTIRHGALQNINMPAMTMVFAVTDKVALARLKTGDKITFIASNDNGHLAAKNVTLVE